MTIRIICVTLLFACLAGISGCSSRAKVFPEEIKTKLQQDYTTAVVPAKIGGVVPHPDSSAADRQKPSRSADGKNKSQHIINFDSLGGSIDFDRRTVTGVAQESTYVEIPFDNIRYVQLALTDVAPRYATLEGMKASLDRADEKPWERIKLGHSDYFDVITFNKHKGKYDTSKDAVIGVTKKGTPIELELDQVHHLEYKTIDPYKQVRIVLGLSGLVVFILGSVSVFD